MWYFWGKFIVKTYFPPATPISYQERANSTEYPKKAKRSENEISETILKKYLSDVIFSRKIFHKGVTTKLMQHMINNVPLIIGPEWQQKSCSTWWMMFYWTSFTILRRVWDVIVLLAVRSILKKWSMKQIILNFQSDQNFIFEKRHRGRW